MTGYAEKLQKDLGDLSARVNASAMDALQNLFDRLLGTNVVLEDGRVGTIKALREPERGPHGNPSASIKIMFYDGSGHLEFTISQSGWGGRHGRP